MIYAFFPKGQRPTSVRIMGARQEGDRVFDITLQFAQVVGDKVPDQARGMLVHRCAARRLIRELEDSTAKTRMIEASVKYNVLCSQTSFVALEKRSEAERQKALAARNTNASPGISPRDDSMWALISVRAGHESSEKNNYYCGGRGYSGVFGGGGSVSRGASSGGSSSIACMALSSSGGPPRPVHVFGGGGGGGGTFFGGSFGGTVMTPTAAQMCAPVQQSSTTTSTSVLSRQRERERDRDRDRDSMRAQHSNSPASAWPGVQMSPTQVARYEKEQAAAEGAPLPDDKDDDDFDMDDNDDDEKKKKSKRAVFDSLVRHQEFDGKFAVGPFQLGIILGVAPASFNKSDPFCDDLVWCTALAIAIFESYLQEFRDEWEMMIENARAVTANHDQAMRDAAAVIASLKL